jgi:hypothetical protein
MLLCMALCFVLFPLFAVGYMATHREEMRTLRAAKKAGDPEWTSAWKRLQEQERLEKHAENVIRFPENRK